MLALFLSQLKYLFHTYKNLCNDTSGGRVEKTVFVLCIQQWRNTTDECRLSFAKQTSDIHLSCPLSYAATG